MGKELSTILNGVRARKTEARVGATFWKKPICSPELTQRRQPNFDNCGLIFRSPKLSRRRNGRKLEPLRAEGFVTKLFGRSDRGLHQIFLADRKNQVIPHE